MDFIKTQKEILTLCLKGKPVVFGKVKDKVVYGSDHHVYITPDKQVGIDFTNLRQPIKQSTLECIINDKDADEVYLSPNIIADGKDKLRVFENGDIKIYVNEKLLKNFDLLHSTFKGTTPVRAVYIYEDGVMVGLVLPTRYKK